MKQILTLATIFMMFIATTAMGQAEKTLVKSIATENMTAAILELSGQVNTSEWDNNFIRITATIEVSNSSEEVLKKLIVVGRYDIQTATDADNIIISMPKVAHFVTIKGVDLNEVLKFEVQMPYGVKANIITPSYFSAAQQAM